MLPASLHHVFVFCLILQTSFWEKSLNMGVAAASKGAGKRAAETSLARPRAQALSAAGSASPSVAVPSTAAEGRDRLLHAAAQLQHGATRTMGVPVASGMSLDNRAVGMGMGGTAAAAYTAN